MSLKTHLRSVSSSFFLALASSNIVCSISDCSLLSPELCNFNILFSCSSLSIFSLEKERSYHKALLVFLNSLIILTQNILHSHQFHFVCLNCCFTSQSTTMGMVGHYSILRDFYPTLGCCEVNSALKYNHRFRYFLDSYQDYVTLITTNIFMILWTSLLNLLDGWGH